MSEWIATTLGNLCEFKAGGAFPKKYQGQAEGTFPFVKVSDMTLAQNSRSLVAANHWVSSEIADELRARPVQPGSTVFAKIGEGLRSERLRRIIRPTLIDNNMMAAFPKGGTDADFLYYFLHVVGLSDVAEGSALPYLRAGDLANVSVVAPSRDEQRRIASVLGAFDDLIETNRGMASQLENAVSAQFAAAGFDRTPMGASIPLGELIEVNPKLSKPSGEAPYIDMAALPTSSSRITSVERRPAAGGARFQNGDSLLARVTPCLENGKAAHVDVLSDGEVAVGSTEFLVLRDRGVVGPQWAYLLSRSTRFRDYAMRHMSGSSGRQRCSAGSIEQYPIDPPSPECVETFRSFAEPAFRSIREIHEENEQLTRTRDELLPLLMSGKVRVEDVEIPKGAA